MSWLNKAWDLVNGQKTTIGAVTYFIGKGLVAVGVVVGDVIVEVGQFVMFGGLAHKAGKAYKNGKSGELGSQG